MTVSRETPKRHSWYLEAGKFDVCRKCGTERRNTVPSNSFHRSADYKVALYRTSPVKDWTRIAPPCTTVTSPAL